MWVFVKSVSVGCGVFEQVCMDVEQLGGVFPNDRGGAVVAPLRTVVCGVDAVGVCDVSYDLTRVRRALGARFQFTRIGDAVEPVLRDELS